jgi:adenylate cyclase
MNQNARNEPSAEVRATDLRAWWRLVRNRSKLLAILLLIVLVAAQLLDAPLLARLRNAWFDIYQTMAPRTRESGPAVIVAIDEASLADLGQWPWPRSLLAQLVERIQLGHPAAIGIDLMFPEPDRMSASRAIQGLRGADPNLVRQLAKLPDNDELFAAALRKSPAVLGIAGFHDLPDALKRSGNFTPLRQSGKDALPFVPHYNVAMRSVASIDNAARGHAILSADLEGGVVRRMPLVAAVGDTLVPSMSLELLRVASGAPAFSIQGGERGVVAVGVRELMIPTQPDGSVWIHFSHRDAGRFVSAGDVLSGKTDGAQFENKLVLIGVTGIGLVDLPATPIGERMPGIEIHAQVLESIFDGTVLLRPFWALGTEALALALLGVFFVLAIPVLRPRSSVALAAGALLLLWAIGFASFKVAHLLFDASVPSMGLGLVFAAVLTTTLSEADAQRRALRLRLRQERETAAMMAGELEAARRIQVGILPRAAAFQSDARFDIFAHMEPAKIVGGDLYDFFKLDPDRLFFLIGDVSGKGLPASMFMAVSKALCKCIATHHPQDIAAAMREVNSQISRENPEMFFVTLIACILDLRSGHLDYCNAGHDLPCVLKPASPFARSLAEGSGPPLCTIAGFPYQANQYVLSSGETLCMVTDGVTEAMNAGHQLFGHSRLMTLLAEHCADPAPIRIGNAIRDAVAQFAGAAEPADDVTILAIRWNGSAS